MADDMSSAINALKGILGDNADEKIQSVMNSLGAGGGGELSESQSTSAPTLNDDSMQYIMRMKGLIDEMSHSNDARSNLLLSLKPYMRQSRQQGIDNALRLLSLSKFSAVFKNMQ